MPLSLQVQCPARVHLFLAPRRGGLPSARQAAFSAKLNLFDVLDAEELGKPGFESELVDQSGEEPRPGEADPVRAAFKAFLREFGFGEGVRFRLSKRIPRSAGLGCSDSAAAGTLLALARIHRLPPDRRLKARLRRLAAGLGPEVPFFLEPGTFADQRKGPSGTFSPEDGRRPVPWMVLAVPRGGFSPSESFLTTRPHLDTLDALRKKIEKGRPIPEWDGLLHNCLEEAVLDRHPEVRQAKSILLRLGLKGVHVSGSGCAVHGFVPSHAEGERVFRLLKGYPWRIFLTCCLG